MQKKFRKGIDLSRRYYEEFGRTMLEKEFSDILDKIAVGFVGSGSERYGFDDELSLDHDYEVGFSIFLPSEDVVDRKTAFRLERAYQKLPKEFMGIKRAVVSPVGGDRNGVISTAEFYLKSIGSPDGNLSKIEWLTIPDYAFFESTDGEVFFDGYGEFTKIRNKISDMPCDVRKKRLAGNLLLMSQAGQYNFLRLIKRGEKQGATLAISEFVTATLKSVFILNKKYCPYYKWAFRALNGLGEKEIYERLSYIVLTENESEENLIKKSEKIEEICSLVAERLREKKLSDKTGNNLEAHAYAVNDGISDGEIRNYNILISVN